MNPRTIAGLAGVLLAASLAHAQQGTNAGLGRYEYHSRCGTCHGLLGKGDGEKAKTLAKRPADLTRLSKDNGGVFPADRLRAIIDGRAPEIAAHGKREMPVWGKEYRAELSESGGAKAANPEVYVAGRIDALLAYLASIQAQ